MNKSFGRETYIFTPAKIIKEKKMFEEKKLKTVS